VRARSFSGPDRIEVQPKGVAVRESAQNLREYETLFVLRPDLEDKVAIELLQKMKGVLAKQGGTHIKLSNWGRKKLAWERDRQQKGLFVQHRYLGAPGIVKEYDRALTLEESVLLRQTVVVNRNVDPATVAEEEDQLTAPVMKERREERDRDTAPRGRSNASDDDGNYDD
jgi:small subunit ribosomal protein S6